MKLQDEMKESSIIVEGLKDKKVLSKLGIKNVLDISGKSFDNILEKVDDSVIILTDFDREGRKKASALIKLFQSNGIKINFFIRQKFRSLFKIQKIEELNSFTKLLEDDIHGKISSVHDKIFNKSRILNRWSCRKTRHNRGNIWTD